MKIKKMPMPYVMALFVILIIAMATLVILTPASLERDSSSPLWYSLGSSSYEVAEYLGKAKGLFFPWNYYTIEVTSEGGSHYIMAVGVTGKAADKLARGETVPLYGRIGACPINDARDWHLQCLANNGDIVVNFAAWGLILAAFAVMMLGSRTQKRKGERNGFGPK